MSHDEMEFVPEYDETPDAFDAGVFDEPESFDAGEEFPLEDDFSADDLEAAYRRAMEVLDEADQSARAAEEEESNEPAENAAEEASPPASASADPSPRDETVIADDDGETSASFAELDAAHAAREPASGGGFPTSSSDGELPELAPGSPLTPRHVIEAALFVGGAPLTTKKLASLFKGSYENAYIEQQIDDLNRHYLAQNRPYQIQLVEGGHRLTLRPEFEKIRHRVFGFGPKEVRLSQDALEVLALVAYQQPIHRNKVEECGKKNVSNVLNQLVRRELIAVTRGKNAKDLTYHTTPRFLSLFGIGSLDELPRPDDLAFK